MTFGGEPLLHVDTVCLIHTAALEMHIPKRQLITNGFFTKNEDVIVKTAESLANSGINDVLLSVDAFHQESIPIEPVMAFAVAARDAGLPIRTHPAWLVDREHDNPYNRRTRDILQMFDDIDIVSSKGNIIFPGGNALKYLGEYFDNEKQYINPYEDNPTDIRAICFSPSGDVLNGNIHKNGIAYILEHYTPM